MSDKLSKECDSLLTTTSIFDHHYGITDITKNHLKFTSNNETLVLETKYHKLYDELSHKLNKLTYLNKVDELNTQYDDKIEDQYHEILNNKLDKMPILEYDKNDELSKLQAIRKFYEFQIGNFKTNILLNNYLQITLPILRSIHQLDTGITTTELNISQNLSTLYSNIETDSEANINTLIKFYQESNTNNKILDDLTSSISSKLNNELKFKLKELNKLNFDLEEKHNAFIGVKETQIKEILNGNNDQIYEKFNSLVNEWSYISIICEFLSGFITSLPIDWYQDKLLRKVIFEGERISLKISKYQLIININTFKNFDLKNLYMIDLDELKFDNSSNED